MYCILCEEERNDHPSICTACGENLQPRPPQQQQRQSTSTSSRQLEQLNTLANILNNDNNNNGILPDNINRLTTILNNTNNITIPNNNDDNNTGEIWEQPPAEALDPTNAQNNNNRRATSKKFIDHIPRINIDSKSFILYDATVQIPLSGTKDGIITNYTFHATIGELSNGKIPPYKIRGIIKTIQSLKKQKQQQDNNNNNNENNVIAYFTRGGGVTFTSMIEQAKEVGAIGIIVVNNSSVWPYVMKGSLSNNTKTTIPAIMIKRSDGKLLYSQITNANNTAEATITVKKTKNEECVICKENFKINDLIIRLPFCFHYFHEECALYWLRKNNTCPCCRKELPTDDEEYELERRNRGGYATGSNISVSSEDNWESMFG